MAYSDRMFFSCDDPEPERVALELSRRGGSDLNASLEEIGVYVDSKQVMQRGNEPGPPAAMLISAIVGRVAFGDRVQRPDQEAVNEAFDDLADRMVEDEYEERRRALDD